MPLISVLSRQKQADLCEFEARLVYEESPRIARTGVLREALSQQTSRKKKKKEEIKLF